MTAAHLPFDAPLPEYRDQAARLLAGHRAGDAAAIGVFHHHHPRFLDPVVTWKPRDIPAAEIAAATLDLGDAQLALARSYSYRDWAALAQHVEAQGREGSPVRAFELAVEAVITGDLDGLAAMLRAEPDLVRARSTRVTCHDPAVHGATLLHYLAANGVEGYRQKSPANAVAIACVLLARGAEVDALAGMYGAESPTLSMLASSTPPAEAGVQVPLLETLLDFGAAVEGCGTGRWLSPLRTALVFGFLDAAQTLVSRGARVDTVVIAAGLGRAADVARLLATADAADRHGGLALAAQLGHTDVVRLLLDAGEDPDRFNPDGFHAHGTPLHHAALGGHREVVEMLVERGARPDIRDKLWHSTALGWANHGGRAEVAEYLKSQGGADD